MSKSGGKSGKSGNKSGARRTQRGGAKLSSQREMARMQQRQRERIRQMTIIVGGFIGVIVVIAALAQSFGPAQATNPGGATTPTTAVPTSSPIVRQVDVTLTDNAISSSMTSFVTGVQYHFVVHNNAQSARDFMIAPPFQSDESMEQMVKAALFHLSAQALAPGTLQTFDFVFDSPTTAGQLQLSTPPAGQASAGTHLAITVAQG